MVEKNISIRVTYKIVSKSLWLASSLASLVHPVEGDSTFFGKVWQTSILFAHGWLIDEKSPQAQFFQTFLKKKK